MTNNYNSNGRSSQPKASFGGWLRLSALVAIFASLSLSSSAVSVTVTNPANATPNFSASYATLALAIADVSNRTAYSGPVILTCTASGTETAPAGGYVINFTATTTGTNNVTIDGASSVITAPAQTSGSLVDAIFKINGSDFVTIKNFTMQERSFTPVAADLTAGTNTMTEFGVALFYNGTTNGAQNITIQNNTITLNRTYQNTWGIYSNSTHSATVITTSASATTTAGGNSGLKVYSNTISNVNFGICVIGPLAAADQNNGVDIGGTSLGQGNSITNWGTTTTFSGYANVSGTMNGILIRNSYNVNASYNTLTSSAGGITTGSTVSGINLIAFTAASTATSTNTINNNTISVTPGVTGTLNGIIVSGTSFSSASSLSISNNNFTALNHTVAATGSITAINSGATLASTNISNNTFTNLSTSTTGSFTFFSNAISVPAIGNTQTISGNSIVTAFAKTGAGGTVTVFSSNASSVTGSIISMSNNNFSNITLTGATSFVGLNNTDGGSPTKTFNGNTFNNISGGTGSINPMTVNFFGGASSVSNNTITNINNWGASVTALTIGGSSTATTLDVNSNTINTISSTAGSVIGLSVASPSTVTNVSLNTINTLSSSATSTSMVGISIGGATTTNVFSNKIYDLSGSTASSTVNGALISSGTTVNAYNNIIGDLRATIANAANPIIGLNITGGTTVNAYYNSIYLNASSSGALFGTSGIFASTSPTLTLRNNMVVNTSTSNGTGNTAAYRRSSGTAAVIPSTYTTSSNNNLFYAGAPSASNLIYVENTVATFTNAQQTLAGYKTFMSTRDQAAQSANPTFQSTTGSSANFLKFDLAVASALESNAANIATFTTDYAGTIRFGNAGSTSTGTAPDIGAWELNGTPLPLCAGTPATSTVNGAASVCTGTGTSLSLSVNYTDIGISYQWASSTTLGGPYTTTLGTAATQATGNLTVPVYYVCTITCSFSGLSFTTAEKSVLVNALPTVAVSPTSGSYCTPGGAAVALTASGASTYAWSPASGLSATTGTSVNASPTGATTYTVTGTDGNGCTNTATSAIAVNKFPTGVTATATPANVCSGSTSNLTSTASTQNTAILPAAYGFAGTAGTYTAITGTTLGAGAIGDDVSLGSLPIGFTFNYNGISQTLFGAHSNGLIILGQTGNTTSGNSSNAIATTANVIAPLWDDNNTTGGSIIYATTGSPGSRVLTVQWTGLHVAGGGSSTNPTIDMQLKLYEANGAIQFIYGAQSAALSSPTASIGISGASGNFLSVTPGSPATSSTASSAAEFSVTSGTNLTSGTTYSFTPAAFSFTYSWAATTNLVSPSSQNTATTALTANETFTVSVNNAGCITTATAAVAIASGAPTVAITPAGPVSLCGAATQVLTAAASGGGTPYSYAWTLNGSPTGTNSATLTASVSGTYVVTVTDACTLTGVSNSVVVTVNPNPGATASTGGAVCEGQTLSLNGGTTTGTTFAWNGPNTFTSSSASPTISSVTAAAAGTYTLTVTGPGGCTSTATTVATIKSNPSTVTVTPSTSTICSGNSQTLVASGGTITSGGNATLGTGVTLTGATTQPTAFCNRWAQYWNQTIYTVAELNAAGLSVGSTINSVTYTTTTQGDANNNTNFSIRIANTASATLSAFQTTGFTTVFGPTSYTHSVGANLITFSTPFTWNGTSNIILDVIQDGVDLSNNAITTFTAAGTNMNFEAHTSTTSATTPIQTLISTAALTGTASTQRLNVIFGQTSIVNPTWSWSPNTASTASVSVSPTSNTTYTATATINGCSTPGTAAVNVTTVVTSGSATNATCFGGTNGSVTFSATGGAAPYTYTLNGSPATSPVTGLAAATYTVVGTDANGCSGTTTITVGQGTAVIVSGSQSVAPTCSSVSNGEITFSATGGTGPYTYTLNGNPATSPATGLAAGTYSVVATDANSCTGSATVTLTAAVPTVTASNDGPACEGGTINLNASNGYTSYAWSGPLSYSASGQSQALTSVTPTMSGSYSVLATDAIGCTATGSTTILVNPSLPVSVSLGASSTSICSGQTVTFTATPTNGGASPTYEFFVGGVSQGAASSTNTYAYNPAHLDVVTVVLTSNALCATGSPATSNPVTITVSGAVTASVALSSSSVSVCAGTAVTLTAAETNGGTPTYEFFVNTVSQGAASLSNTFTYTPVNGDAVYAVMNTSLLCASPAAATSNTVSIAVTTPSTATFAYNGSPYCSNAGTASVTFSGTTGGTYSSTAGLSINATTGDVNLAASTAGTYSVTYTVAANGPCPAFTTTASITINTLPAATITYAGTPFCTNGTNGSVTLTGTTGGTYSSTAGLSINSSTGLITVASSIANTYLVSYTLTAGGCPNVVATTSVLVNTAPTASISYAGTPYCKSITSSQPVTRTGASGGTYTSTAGLVITASTGGIFPSASTAGTYVVTYTVAASGGCAAVVATTSVTITTAPTATISYAGPFLTSNITPVAVTLTGTTGGTFSAPAGLTIDGTTGAINASTSTLGSYIVTYTVAASGGCAAFTTSTVVTIVNGTSLISAADGGFENGPNFAVNGWTFLNNATGNNWFVGTVSVPFAGSNAAYISDNATGTTWNYNITSPSTVYFYRDVTFPAGQPIITLTFQWKNTGESGFDRPLVFTAPTTFTPTLGVPASNTSTQTGATLVSPTTLTNTTTYSLATIALPSSFAGTTQRILFAWQSDNSFGANPPASIDNIAIVSSVSFVATPPSCALTYSPASGAIDVVTLPTLSWSGAAGSPSPSGYDVYLSTNSALVTALDPSVRVSANQAGTTFTPAAALSLSTTYYWTIIPKNSGGDATACVVNSFSTHIPGTALSTTLGGLWSSPQTWVNGIVPTTGDNVVIADGSVVTVDQIVNTIASLTVGQGTSGVLAWNGTANAMTFPGNLTIATGARFLPYSTAGTGVTLNIGGNISNNGYTNMAASSTLINLNGSQQVGGSAAQSVSGGGTFQGNGTDGIIRALFSQTTGSTSVSTSQNIATGSFAVTAGSINTGGKVKLDNTIEVYGQSFNQQVASVAVTNMGSLYGAAPFVLGASASPWVAGGAATLNTRYFSGNNVYIATTAGTFDATTAPSHISGSVTNGTAPLLWLGTIGTLGNPFQQTPVILGTQYFYGGNLYTCIAAGTPSAASPPVHGSGPVASGTATFLYVGSPATVSTNWDPSTQTVRSLSLTSAGSGYTSAPSIVVNANGSGSSAAATAVFFQQIAGAPNSQTQKSGSASITGGLTINSTQGASAGSGVGAITTTGGGVNYTVAPTVGFAGPTMINLVTAGGSGFTSNPTITLSGGTLVSGTALTTTNFTITVNQGKVVSVYLNPATTATYSVLPTLAFTGGAGTGATLAFPAGCLPTATANLSPNRQITSFTITNAGFGYNAAPTMGFGPTSGTALGGTFSTAATAPTCRLGLYSIIYNNFTPSPANTVNTEGAEIPANRKVLSISLGSPGLGAIFSGNLEAIGTAPLTLTNGFLNMGGNNLLFSWNGFAGTTGSLTQAVKNASITLTTRGGGTTGSTLNFPFEPTFTCFTGTGTTAANGASVLTVTATQTAAPSGAGAIGTRAYRAQVNPGAVYGTNPTVTLNWNANDALVSDQTSLFVGQSAALTGAWVTRSISSGTVNAALATTGSRTTATIAPGPLVNTGDDYYAFLSTFVSAPLAYNITRTTNNNYNSIIATGTVLGFVGTSNDDNTSPNITIPGSTFTYNGQTITGFNMCTNGWIKLNSAVSPATTSTTFSNSFGSAGISNIIAAFWDDLTTNPNSGGLTTLNTNTRYQIIGSTPGSRQIVCEWFNYTVFGAAGPQLNFQIVLDETDNSIKINYGLFQGFNGTNNHRYTYSVGLGARIVSGFPLAGQVLAQQYENSDVFTNGFVATLNSGANALMSIPECNSSLSFIPGAGYTGGTIPSNAAPSNDNAAGAIAVAALTSFPSNLCGNFYTSRNATASPNTVCAGNADDDVWFKFVPTIANTTVRVYGSGGYVPRVQVLDALFNPLSPAQCVVGTAGGVQVDANLIGIATGVTYYVRVYHDGGGVQATATAFVNAGGAINNIVVANGGSGYTATTTGAITTARVRITGGGGTDGTGTAVITGGVVTGITLTQAGYGYTSAPTVTIESPAWAHIGEFALVVYAPAINDDCANATNLNNLANPGCNTGSNFATDNTASATASAEAACTGTASADVWYKFTAVNTTTSVTVNSTGTFDAVAQIFDGGVAPGTCATKTSVQCLNATGAGGAESIFLTTVVGNTYFVRIYHAAGGTGGTGAGFTICVTSAVPSCVSTPTPANGGNGCVGNSVLSWPAIATATSYDVYYDLVDATTLVSPAQVGTSYTIPTPLTAGPTVYHWKVVPKNVFGDAVGCTEFTFTVVNPPVVTVTPTSATFCSPGGSPISITASGASSYAWSPATGLSAATGATVSASPLNSTTYTVTGTDAISGCTASASTIITVAPSVIMNSVTANPANVCANGTSVLSAVATTPSGIAGYLFGASTGALDPMVGAVTAIGTSNDDTPTATSSPIGFNFTFNGTTYSDFSVSPDGWILLGTTTAVSSFGNSATLTTNTPKIYPYWDDLATGTDGSVKTLVTGTAPNRILVVQWNVTIPRNTTGSANSTFQAWLYETTGQIEFRYGVMGVPSSGSISSGLTSPAAAAFQSITFATGSTSSVTANDANAIAPATGTMYTYSIGAPVTYAWTETGSTLLSTTGSPVTATPIPSTTTYTVTASANGCSTSGTVTVNVDLLVVGTPTISGTNTCVGIQQVNATVSGGGAPYNYSWTEDGVAFGGNTASIFPSSGSHTYIVTVLDNCGSSQTSASLTVVTAPNPSISITSSGSICAGVGAVTLTASGGSTYAWSPATGLSATTGAIVIATPSNPSTVYTVIGTSALGCTSSATATVVNNPALNVVATATPTLVCNGASSALLATGSVVPASLLYCVPTQSGGSNVLNVTFNTLNHTNPTPVSPFYNIIPASTATTAVVQGTTYTFSLTNDGGSAITSVWIDYNQNGDFEASEWNQVYTSATSGTISITIPLTAANGYTGMRVRSRLSGNPNSAVDGCNAVNIFGSGSSVDYTILIGTPPSPGVFTYAWTSSTSSPLSATNIANPTAGPLATGTHTYTVVATEASGCTTSATVSVVAGAALVPTASVNTSTACSVDGITLTGSATGGGIPYTYSWVDGATAFTGTVVGSTPTLVLTPSVGTHLYWLVVSDICGNTVATSTGIPVTINQTPNVTVTSTESPVTICGTGSIHLNAAGANSYAWSPVDGLDVASGPNVVATPSITTSYTVIGTSLEGCTSSASITVNYSPVVVVNSVTADLISGCAPFNTTLHVDATAATSPNYVISSIAATTPTPISPTTVAFPSTDDAFLAVALPFPFNFYGASYSNIYIGTNGYLSFTDLTGVSAADLRAVTAFPTAAIPNNRIAIGLSDLDVLSPGSVKTWQSGTDFIIQFNQVQQFFSASNTIDGYVILHSANNTVDIIVNSSNITSTHTLGIENVDGTLGSSPVGRNNTTWTVSTPEAWRFTPPSSTLTYAWSPATALSATNIANPNVVNLASSQTYSVTVTNAVGCTATGSVAINLTPAPNPIVVDNVGTAYPASITLCSGDIANFKVVDANPLINYSTLGYLVDWTSGPQNQLPTASVPSNLLGGFAEATVHIVGCSGVSNSVAINTFTVGVSTSVTPATCLAGGSITTTVSNTGTGPYTYNYYDALNVLVHTSSSALTTDVYSNVPVGNYTVVVSTTSPACSSAPTAANVTAAPALSITTSATAETCSGLNDGIVSVASYTNGSGNYSYLWSPGGAITSTVFGLAPGVYTVLVTDNLSGCTATGSASVIAAPMVTYSTVTSNATCFGSTNGSISIDFSLSPVSVTNYDWTTDLAGTNVITSNSDLTGVGAGSYYVHVFDPFSSGACEFFLGPFVITEPAQIVVSSFSPANDVVGATVTINGSGFTLASAVSFNGTPAVTVTYVSATQLTAVVPVGATTGTVTVTNGTCFGTSTAIFTVDVATFTTFNLKAFIEGYYIGGGAMNAVNFNIDGVSPSTEADTIIVELHDPFNSYAVVEADTIMLNTDGTTTMNFSTAITSQSLYVGIRGRNIIETWSHDPILFTSTTSYDFTTASLQAYDDLSNLPMKEVEPGVWAFYSGDVTDANGLAQDGGVDGSDIAAIANDANLFAFGYNATDLTGDGATDGADLGVSGNNSNLFLFTAHP